MSNSFPIYDATLFRDKPSSPLPGMLDIEAGDWVFIANGPAGDTISEVVRGWAQRHPVIPFAAGVLMGHFFW